MKHKVGEKVVVVNPYSGSDFEDGEIVTIVRIGDENGFEPDCYGAVRDGENYLWYLYEDEVKPNIVTQIEKTRLVNVDELLLKQRFMIAAPWSEDHDGYAVPVEEIYNAPTIEARPVVRGRWKWVGEDRWNDTYLCSNCGKMNMDDSTFCPNCGADMQEREQCYA